MSADIPEAAGLLQREDRNNCAVHRSSYKPAHSSIPNTSFNFINSIVGSGIIGMPYALRQAGFGLGLILMALIALATDYSIMLLVEGGRLSNTDSYQDLVLASFGYRGFYVLTFFQFVYPFLAMVGYNVIIGDLLTKLSMSIFGLDSVSGSVFGNRHFIIFLATLLVTMPLSMYRDIAKLGKWAFLSITLILFIMITAIIRLSTFIGKIDPTPDAWQFVNYNVPQAVGIMTFSYMCHHNTFLIHSSLENPTHQRWGFVTHFSLLFSMLMCMIFAITGYASFTGHTQGDVMENYCRQDVLINISRACLAITMMLTYPVDCFVTREVVEIAAFDDQNPFTDSPLWRHIAVTLSITSLAMLASMTTDCLGTVLEINGVVCATPLAFIIPPACVLKLWTTDSRSCYIGPLLVLCLGVLIVISGLIMTVINIVDGYTCFHGAEPSYCQQLSSSNDLSESETKVISIIH